MKQPFRTTNKQTKGISSLPTLLNNSRLIQTQ